ASFFVEQPDGAGDRPLVGRLGDLDMAEAHRTRIAGDVEPLDRDGQYRRVVAVDDRNRGDGNLEAHVEKRRVDDAAGRRPLAGGGRQDAADRFAVAPPDLGDSAVHRTVLDAAARHGGDVVVTGDPRHA